MSELSARFWSKVDRRGQNECWPWLAAVRRKDEGYGAFWFQGRHVPASRMAFTLKYGAPQDGAEICHRCDNPQCCNPAHLFAGTRQQNNADKVQKRRHVRGSRINTAVLQEDDVREIRRIAAELKEQRGKYWGAKEVAERYGVTPEHLRAIVRGESWKGVDDASAV